MRFNEHSRLKGFHAFLSPSQYHWINYSAEKLRTRFMTSTAAAWGVDLHAYAAEAIEIREWQMDETQTLGLYINDCIRLGLQTEVVLYYSDNCFGTADAIGLEDDLLMISDLKTGVSKTSEHQLEIYAAIFCLEYDMDPHNMRFELRIYQAGECRLYDGAPKMIEYIMERIREFDEEINQIRIEEEL